MAIPMTSLTRAKNGDWFARKAIPLALREDAQACSVWTIAKVVGHAVENASLEGIKLPLGLTMRRCEGDAPAEAKRACVGAVKVLIG